MGCVLSCETLLWWSGKIPSGEGIGKDVFLAIRRESEKDDEVEDVGIWGNIFDGDKEIGIMLIVINYSS